MHQCVAIDPKAVAALIDERLLPPLRNIIVAYAAGPELWSTHVVGPLDSFQITITWHPGCGTTDNTLAVVNSLIARCRTNSTWVHDTMATGDRSRIVAAQKQPKRVLDPYNPQSLSKDKIQEVLTICHTSLMFLACRVDLFMLDSAQVPIQYVGVHTGHLVDLVNINCKLITDYVQARRDRGCGGDEECKCDECAAELHHSCRQNQPSEYCAFLNQCACMCEYCDDIKNICADERGLCKNQGKLCFSKWRPPS